MKPNKLAALQFSIVNLQFLTICFMIFLSFEAYGLFYSSLPINKINETTRILTSIFGGVVIGASLTTVTLHSKLNNDPKNYYWLVAFAFISLFFTLKFFDFFVNYDPVIFGFAISLNIIEIKLAMLLNQKHHEILNSVEDKEPPATQKFSVLDATPQIKSVENVKKTHPPQEKKYNCQYCDKELSRKDSLLRHENKCKHNKANQEVK